MKRKEKKTEENLRVMVSTLLRFGVFISAMVIIFGGILFFVQHPHSEFTYRTFNSEPAQLKEVLPVIREALSFKSRPVIQLGILILIATPVLRVLFSIVGFIVEKDWTYVVITGIVTIILFYSLFGY